MAADVTSKVGTLGRALTAMVAVYVLMLGGTFTGIVMLEAQLLSLVLLTSGILVWLIVLWRGPAFPRGVVLGPALAMWSIAIAASALLHPSWRAANAGWWAAFYIGTWLLLIDLMQRGMRARWLTDAALIAAVPVMLIAVAQVQDWYLDWLTLDSVRVAYVPLRPPSTLGNANALGTALAMLFPLALLKLHRARQPLLRVLLVLWVIMAVLVLYLTFSRGAWLSTAAGVGVLAALVLPVRRNWSFRTWWSQRSAQVRLVLIALSILVFIGVWAVGVVSWHAFETPRRDTGTRLALWQVAWDTFRQYPFAGRGPGTYGLSLLENWSFPPNQPHAGAHNLVLHIAAELGLLGLAALAVTVGMVAWNGTRIVRNASDSARRAYRAACAGGLAALGVHSLVDMTLIVPAVLLLGLVLLAALLDGQDGASISFATMATSRGKPGQVFALVCWIGVLATGWWSASNYADYYCGQQALAGGDIQAALARLADAARSSPELPLYHAEYGYACGLAAYRGETECVPAGIAAYERALALEPQHAVWWANLAALYWGDRQSGAALAALRQAVTFAPEAADFWLALGVYQETLGHETEASDAYRQALDAHEEWAYMEFWRTSPLRQYVRLSSGVMPSPYKRAAFLWSAGKSESAIEVLDARIERDPSQPRPYIQLARLHIADGAIMRAKEYLNAARVLVHTRYGRAWLAVVEAELARAGDDLAGYATHMAAAQSILSPGATGYTLLYGQDVAYFHFWRAQIAGVLLPQLPIAGHDPQLTERLAAAGTAAWGPEIG